MITLNSLQLPEAFKTGIASVDQEHQQLIETLNACLNSYDGPDLKDFNTYFEAFIADLAGHFEHEERLMTDAEYPEAKTHADHHRLCIEKLQQLLEQCRTRGYASHQDVADYFKNLIQVIAKADIKFADFLWGQDKMGEYKTR